MLTMTVTFTGKTEGDLDLAVGEFSRRFRGGNRTGFDSNDSGSFHFDVTGEEEDDEVSCECPNCGAEWQTETPDEDCPECGYPNNTEEGDAELE